MPERNMESELMTDDLVLQIPLMPVNPKTKKSKLFKLSELPPNEELDIPAGHPLPEFVQSIYEDGQIEPIRIMFLPEGRLYVADGKRRIATFRILAERFPEDDRWDKIWASTTDEESYETALRAQSISNNQRYENALSDLKTLKYLRDKYPTASNSELARRSGIHPSTLKRRLKLLKLAQPWEELLENGSLVLGTAETIANHTSEVQFKLWAEYQEKGKVTQDMIKEVQKVRVEKTVEVHQDVLFPELVAPPATEEYEPTQHDISPDPVIDEREVVMGWILINPETGVAMSTVVDDEERAEVFGEIIKDNGSGLTLLECLVIAPPQ